MPAAVAIDWTIPGTRIGDRDEPLAAKTLARISAGLRRYATPVLAPTGGTWRTDPTPLDQPMPTRLTRESDGLACPPLLVPTEGRDGKTATPAAMPMRTQTARNETGLACPPLVVELQGGGAAARPVHDPLAIVCARGNHHGLAVPTQTAAMVVRNNDNPGTGVEDCTPATEPLRTLTTTGHQSVVTWRHLIVPYYRTGQARPGTEPNGAVPTRDRYGLAASTSAAADPGGASDFDLDDVLFRMLEPHEIGRAMAFADEYTVLGSKRDKVRQYGNAVTPPVAEVIVSGPRRSHHRRGDIQMTTAAATPSWRPPSSKPPFAYYGGKTALAARIAALLPPHGHYVEPYAGSLAVLLAKRPSRLETVNDLDGDLMTFWRVLRDRPADLHRVCALTPHSRGEYLAARDIDCAPDELERARRVWVWLSQARGGGMRRTGWRQFLDPAGTGSCGMPGYLAGYVARMAPTAARLARVSLERLPALEVIDRYGRHRDVCLYVDPPYLASTRNPGKYRNEMGAEHDHRDLAAALQACQAAVLLSGYDSPLYRQLYRGWHRTEIPTGTGQGGSWASRTEVIWSNRPLRTHTPYLFDEAPP